MSLYNLPPIACFTCRTRKVGRLFPSYLRHMKSSPKATAFEFFENHKIERYCCRRMFITYVEFLNVPENVDRLADDVEKLKMR